MLQVTRRDPRSRPSKTFGRMPRCPQRRRCVRSPTGDRGSSATGRPTAACAAARARRWRHTIQAWRGCFGRPVMILSGNSIDHALLTLAGHTAGIPVAPVSVAYSLQSQDHAKLKHIAELLEPGLIYVADTAPFAKALAALDLRNVEVAAARNGANLPSVTAFDQLAQSRPGPALERAVQSIGPETIAKFLFTSGSTGLP